eukprot:1044903-Prymnesium_polylepis.1
MVMVVGAVRCEEEEEVVAVCAGSIACRARAPRHSIDQRDRRRPGRTRRVCARHPERFVQSPGGDDGTARFAGTVAMRRGAGNGSGVRGTVAVRRALPPRPHPPPRATRRHRARPARSACSAGPS